jgi:hypothetical protein
MSYKQRERKRKKTVAVAEAQKRSRSSGSSSQRWWLTIVTSHTCCARCSGLLRIGREMVYRHTPREALCLPCADRDTAIRYRPSLQWERARRTLRS